MLAPSRFLSTVRLQRFEDWPDYVVLGDNALVTGELLKFAAETARQFLFFPEVPREHWWSFRTLLLRSSQ